MESRELELANTIWEEIQAALCICGDIGEFSSGDFVTEDIPRVMWHDKPVLPELVLKRTVELGAEINEVYWNVFEALAIAAAQKLGFQRRLSIAFADALACIRTGVVSGHKTQPEQCIAQDIYLKKFNYGADWTPNSKDTQGQIFKIFLKFKEWEADPKQHEHYIENFWASRT